MNTVATHNSVIHDQDINLSDISIDSDVKKRYYKKKEMPSKRDKRDGGKIKKKLLGLLICLICIGAIVGGILFA